MNHKLNLQLKLIFFSCLVLLAYPVKAEIIPDNTLGAEASRITPNVLIKGKNANRIDGGAQRGKNLFHSFSQFNIDNGERVYFGNPSRVDNIFTRVTGGKVSNILGTLGVDGAANLFLINPSGIIFGENARLDVNGSFLGTTGNGVRFGEQGVFSATNPETPGLLNVNPNALFFNQMNQSAVIENNSLGSGLRVPDGKSLLLVGGSNISMDGGRLNAPSGRIELGGLTGTGSVNMNVNGDKLSLQFPDNVTRADVLLTNKAGVYVEGNGNGDIAINARNVGIFGKSRLSAGIVEGLGSHQTVAGDITLNTTGEIQIAGFGSQIRNVVGENAIGNGGKITINSGSLKLLNQAQIATSLLGSGNAGSVNISAKDDVTLHGGASIFSTVESMGDGDGGNIDINAATLSLKDGAQLSTTIRSPTSDNQLGGFGNAGDVSVKVTGVIDIAGKKDEFRSGIRTNVENNTLKSSGGNITLDAHSVKLRDGAVITTSNFGQTGIAGKVEVNATDTVSITDAQIFSTIKVGELGPDKQLSFFDLPSLPPTDDISGKIIITSPKIILDNGGILNTDSASGSSGEINLNSDLLLLRSASKITSNASVLEQRGGDGGNITIDSKLIVALAQQDNDITANAFEGKGGNINIKTKGIFGIQPNSAPIPGENNITASSEVGVQGEILISELDIDPEQGIIELPTNFEDKSDRIGKICPRTAKAASNISKFTITGRGSLPPSPLKPFSGKADLTRLATLDSDVSGTGVEKLRSREEGKVEKKVDKKIIEAQGFMKSKDGNIYLVAQTGRVTPNFRGSASVCSTQK